ncbi:MAG: substrate-binding domain-containing protein, partial [Methanospirillum sp.]|uniref:substrate-binding domain-containing protein n=1 Tax=Methanospirillum sp. TaxID=45200 RepID=UPI0023719714
QKRGYTHMMKRALIMTCLLLAVMLICGGASAEKVKDLTDAKHASDRLLIATTTSLDATGVLDELSKKFAEENNVSVEWIAVGTGQAIGYGQTGDVDVVMVHDRAAEDKFLDAGNGLDRRVFASNYFMIGGPESDPAKIAGKTASEAFKAISEAGNTDTKVVFVSRGDGSGTHSREKLIWKSAGLDYTVVNKSPWYIDAAAGMGQTITMANEKDGYTLADASTWNSMQSNITLVPLVTDGKDLLNIYAVIRVNPDKFPNAGINVDAGKKWENFLISDDTQKLIADFGTEKYGKPLFVPAKGDAANLNVTEAEISSPVE